MGRQKIQMKKIENDEALQVCFSKRRTGLFKKASELSTLCGAEVAIVVFSPAGRPYSIGLPDMDTVLDRFLLCNPTNEEHEYYHHRNTTLMLTCHRNVIARDLNRQVMELRSLLDQQRGRRTPLEMMARNAARSIGVDSGPDFEGLNLDRLSRLESEIKQLRCRVAMRVDELMRRDNLNQPLPPPTSLPFLPEAGVPTAHLNQAGFVDPPTGFLDPDSGFFRSGGTGVANGSGPSDAPFMYSDPFPDPCAAGGACQASFPSEFI